MAKECKKFALFACCLMTMQALRLVISTAGFCVTRFHIDCELFGIFISRLVNAVYMAQLFGNWLGDLIVFTASGSQKLIAVALANWAELITFCSALACFCAGEEGMLNGFYWSMVMAYFFWKVGEAPCISVGVDEVDWYFAGFTLSGVWAACLKALVMMFVGEKKGVYSQALGEVNVTVVSDVGVVGRRSVKTTVDYRAAKWLFFLTILLTMLMCLVWEAAQVTAEIGAAWVWGEVAQWAASETDNKFVKKIKTLSGTRTVDVNGSPTTRNLVFTNATWKEGSIAGPAITIKVEVKTDTTNTSDTGTIQSGKEKTNTKAVEDEVKKKVEAVIDEATDGKWAGKEVKMAIVGVKLEGTVPQVQSSTAKDVDLTIKVTVLGSGGIVAKQAMVVAGRTAVVLGGIMAVPGAVLFVALVRTVCKCFTTTVSLRTLRKWAIAGGVFASVVTICAFGGYMAAQNQGEMWLPFFKWSGPDYAKKDNRTETDWNEVAKVNAAIIGLGAGTFLGAFVGLCIGACTGAKKRGTAAGAFIGSFVGLWTGEIVNGYKTWKDADGKVKNIGANGAAKGNEWVVVSCGFFIVVAGLGTVYSIYPGMAPCSITQFKYFNIIDICILALSSIGPIFIMGIDLAEEPWRLGKTIMVGWDNKTPDGQPSPTWGPVRMWGAIGTSLLMTIATIICEIIVLSIMQHPHSKQAQKVTNSGWRACTLTILMVSFQLTSTGIGFGCVAAGSGFNDGIYNALSTSVLWTMECCGVLGEGYLTELKKYESGKWPTQGMGKWATYKWWNRKAFGNAWAIWCCIGTTDLRRDIMLCRQ